MMRNVALAAGLAVVLVAGGVRVATSACPASKCDAGVTKAAGKKTGCKTKVIAKGQAKATAPDAGKLSTCETKFSAACAKAKGAGDCCAQTQTCAQVETEVNSCVTTISSSPSGAFLS